MSFGFRRLISLPVRNLALIGCAAGVAGLSASAVGCSNGNEGAGARLSTVSSEIQGGQVDNQGLYPFAVGIADTQRGSICSGALIGPNLVLTARHCIADLPGESVDCTTDKFGSAFPASGFAVTTDGELDRQAQFYRVRKIVVPQETDVCGNDIALLILNSNVPAQVARLVTPAVAAPITDRSIYGSSFTAIGYGLTSPADETSAGIRRYKKNISIECYEGATVSDCGGQIEGVTNTEFVSAGGTCQGDSGSSAFDQKAFDKGELVSLGVLSRGGQSRTQCLGAVYTRVDKFRDLIIATGIEAAQVGGYNPPAWTNAPGFPTDTPDAGAPQKPDAGKPTPKKPGEACAKDAECASNACVSGKCVESCKSDGDCDDGQTCVDSICVEKPADNAPTDQPAASAPVVTTTTTRTTGPCTVANVGGNTPSGGFAWLGVAAVVGAFSRRRRSRG
jgi:MYXO-CTERM domain-containing protein